jgi:hypothetical protein
METPEWVRGDLSDRKIIAVEQRRERSSGFKVNPTMSGNRLDSPAY